MKISTPILGETTMEDFIPKVIEFGKTAERLKKHYPSVWKTIVSQFGLEIFSKKSLSKELFERKLEIMILQDEETRDNS